MPVVASIVAALVLALAVADPAVAASRYTVVPHDTLFSIARRFRVPLSLLEQVNGIRNPSRIRIGEVLVIPDGPGRRAAGPAPARGPQPAAGGGSYVVLPGDTLYHLALTHGTTVEALEAANGLVSPGIIVGQVIRFPEPATPVRTVTPPAQGSAPDEGPVPDGAGTAGESPEHAVAPALTDLVSRVRAAALGYVGTPYRWGGTTPAGVDCSGLVYLVYSPYVATLPRTSYDQWTAGVGVDRADLAAGDLVFFNMDGTGASHVGIYVGDGQFVHPAASAQRVVVDRLDEPYYATHYLGARRIL